MKESIKVEDLTKQYGDRTVVDHLSFSVEKGEVYGLLGHNGAGKSTTIDCILGLKKPDGGKTFLLGRTASKNRKELFEKVGVQLQHSNYQDYIKVKEICEEISSLYANPLPYRDVLKRFHLDSFLQHKVAKLSGGERQKLSVVLALLPNPEVIFLDELTTGLDVEARRTVWKILKDLKQQGMTIFLTTHYMEEAEYLCDRICIMKAGRKIVEGTIQEVLDQSPHQKLEEAYLWYVGEESCYE